MKLRTIALIAAAAILSMGASSVVLAQTTASSTVTNDTAQQWASNQAHAPATRAQVYQALVQTETDGQLKHLNATVYAHH